MRTLWYAGCRTRGGELRKGRQRLKPLIESLQPGASCDSAATRIVSECRLEGGGREETTPRMRFTHCEGVRMMEWPVYSHRLPPHRCYMFISLSRSRPYKTGQGPLCHTNHFSPPCGTAEPLLYCSVPLLLERMTERIKMVQKEKKKEALLFLLSSHGKVYLIAFLKYETTFAKTCLFSNSFFFPFQHIGLLLFFFR